jgi:hypothetical protein
MDLEEWFLCDLCEHIFLMFPKQSDELDQMPISN